MSKIKIGQIGTAHGHAAGKLASYRKSADFEVVGLVEPDPQLRSKAEASPDFRDVTWMSVEQLLNVPDLKAVAIETEPKHLLAHAETCVNAGFHIHLDKPAGESLSHFHRILDTAARKHLCVQMGYMFRYNPAIVLLRSLLQKGFLGEPFEVHAVMSKVVDETNRLRHGEYQGGMMFELGCHVIDLLVGFLGRPSSVVPFFQHAGPQTDNLKDNMLAVFNYPKAIATVKSSALEVDGFARRQFTVCGTEGTAHIEPLDSPKHLRLTLAKQRSTYQQGRQELPLEPYTRYVDDAIDFAKVIRGEKQFDWSMMHDLAVQETVLRASGCPVT